nr:swr complex subunit [Polyrhizophydium stewartii]
MLEIQASQTSAFGGPGAGLGDGMSPAAAMARTSSAGSLSGDVVPFTNSARTDSLALGHWSSDPNEAGEPHHVKAHGAGGLATLTSCAADSRFAAQGVQAQVMRFTDEEYDTHLKDPAWSKEDTEHLFALCRELELRFYVIADRFEGSTPRTIEDLKDRYYSVSRALVAARHGAQDPQGKLMTAKYAYDKTREIERRRIIEKLLSRTPEQIEEEEILMHELKKRAASEESWNRERELILRSLMNNELPPQTAVPLVPLSTDPRKKRRPLRGDETPMMAQGVDAIRRRNRDREVDDSPLRKEKLPCGAFLRTSRIQPIKISLQTRATALLDEYRIGARPNMPTAAVCAKFDEVRQLAVALLETKKLVDKAEHELKVAHIRRKTLKDDLAGGRKPAAAAGPALSAPLAGKRPLVSPPVQREHKRARN